MAIFYRLLRLHAILVKEFIQMRHEYMTYLFLIVIPVIQAIFFGFLINTDPKNLPTMIVSNEQSTFTQSIITGLSNTGYFNIKGRAASEAEAENLLRTNKLQFILNIPPNFSHDLVRGMQPHILLEADGTDPVAVVGAYQAINKIIPSILERNMQGSLDYLLPSKKSVILDLQARYNPLNLSFYHTLPGLLAITLTTVLLVLTSVSMANEYEQGTFETLLITPATSLDIILGKLIPHFVVGYSVFFLIIASGYFMFHVPFHGSLLLLTLICAPFMLVTSGIGLICSIWSNNQLEAATYANLYILPNLLLTGFAFPFRGMPEYAQYVGELLPATHFMRIAYSIMLKGSSLSMVWVDVWPILLSAVVIISICMISSRHTLD